MAKSGLSFVYTQYTLYCEIECVGMVGVFSYFVFSYTLAQGTGKPYWQKGQDRDK